MAPRDFKERFIQKLCLLSSEMKEQFRVLTALSSVINA